MYQGPQATLEQLERMESPACQAHQVYQGQLEEGVRGGSQGKEAQWDLLGDPDLVVKLDLKGPMDCQYVISYSSVNMFQAFSVAYLYSNYLNVLMIANI